MKTLIESAAAAKAAGTAVAQLTTEQKNAALLAMADALEANCDEILAANAADMERERANGMSSDMLDRLMLNEKRVADMALGLRQVAELPDPVGEVMREWTRPNGLTIRKVRVPMGVIGIIYEARPNVTVDAASLAFKAGSAILLRGSGSAYESNAAEVRVMRAALESCGVTPDAVCLVEERGHEVVDNMLRLREYIDLIVPRGSARLINNAVEKATVPILQTGTGQLPRLRGQERRLRHGGGHRHKRQDPAHQRLQRGRDPAGAGGLGGGAPQGPAEGPHGQERGAARRRRRGEVHHGHDPRHGGRLGR